MFMCVCVYIYLLWVILKCSLMSEITKWFFSLLSTFCGENIVFGNISFFLNKHRERCIVFIAILFRHFEMFFFFVCNLYRRVVKEKKAFRKNVNNRYRWKIFFETKILWKCALILLCSTLSIFMILRMSRSYLSDFV